MAQPRHTRRTFARKALISAATLPWLARTAFAAEGAPNYTVRRGDTLSHIAARFGVSVRALKRANGLSGDLIRTGQTLRIPAPAASAENPDPLAKVRAEHGGIRVDTGRWKRIIAHHSAIKYGNADIYDRAHRERGMRNGLAYHFLIGNGIDSGDGEIEIGPRWRKQLHGGHVRSYAVNKVAVGICLVGNFEKTHPTRRQMAAFVALTDWLRAEVLRPGTRFDGHKEIKREQTVCPGRHFPLAAMHERYG